MEIDNLSDEVTSSEHNPQNNNKICNICQSDLEKIESEARICEICTNLYCKSCATTSDTSKNICKNCGSQIFQLNHRSLNVLNREKSINKDIISKIMAFQVEIQNNKAKFMENKDFSAKIEEEKLIIERFTNEIMSDSSQILKIIDQISILADENRKLEEIIIEKDHRISKLSEDLKKSKIEIEECRKNLFRNSSGTGDLYLENVSLKARIKELENEQFNYTHHIIEALEILKNQISKEKTENIGLNDIINNSNDKAIEESLKIEQEKVKDLEQELKIAKEHVNVLQKNKGEGFEVLGKENEEDPSTRPCKCIIY